MARSLGPREEYWKEKAEEKLDELNTGYYYGRDIQDYLDLGEQFGYERLNKNLAIQERFQDVYWDVSSEAARDLYEDIYEDLDPDFPEWFWYYHGAAS
jgi:hypothetical protein